MKQKNSLYCTALCILISFLLTGCFESGSSSDSKETTPPVTTPPIVECDLQPITTPPGAFPKDISCFTTFQTTSVWTNGTVRNPSDELRAGRPNSDYLSAGILVFELPDLKGASITSANLSFTVSGSSPMNMDFHTNLNLDALRGSTTRDPVVATDFDSLGIAPPMVTIQEGIVYWDDAFPGVFETDNTGDGRLASWLVCQYEQIGTGGIVYLRITPDQDPISNLYMQIPTASVGLVITTDGNDDPVSGTGDTVSVQMGPHYFSWTFNQDVQWGHFIDGQPWVVEPIGGNLELTSATPARLNSQMVYLYPSTAASPLPVFADINITVKNPPVDHKLVGGSYQNDPNGVFGWDSRTGNGSTSLARYNSTLGWNGVDPMLLSAGDSITTAKSMTAQLMPDRASVLDALAVLTVLDTAPASDAFRPSPLREGVDRTNPEIVSYSDVKDLSSFLIPNPITNGTLGLEGAAVQEIEQVFTYAWLQQLLPGPGFINGWGSASEGVSAIYNNTSYLVDSAGGSYGGYMGTMRFGPLAVGSLATWLTPDERKLCQIRLIQRAIDAYGFVQAGGCLEEGAGILPGYSTLITIAGVMLDSTQFGIDMRSVNEGINGVEPWFIFADYATSFHTDGVPAGDLVTGEVQADRQISLFYNVNDDKPELNKVNITPVLSATVNTITVLDNFYWGNGRPLNDVINLKLRVTAGPGAGNQIYVITDATGFINANGDAFVTGNTFGYTEGGTVTVSPPWVAGIPDPTSTIALSITTSNPGSLASDDARWLWAVTGIVPSGSPAYIEKVKEISTSPIHNYISIQSGATLGNLIALYALDGQSFYKGGLDKFMIDAGTRPGYAEIIFGGVYISAINLQNPAVGIFRGALWRQEVLEHPNVLETFTFTGLGIDSLLIPDPTARMWYE